MKPEALVELIESGNTAQAEGLWMELIEDIEIPPARLADFHVVLRAMCAKEQRAQAEALAWAAIEAVSGRCEPIETLSVAGPFLLAIGESAELRKQVGELYRTAHADFDELDSLIEEAGLGGGRPVRRALRTLDVCLALSGGNFLASRDEDAAARVDAIDRSEWTYSITVPDGKEKLGAVHLADRYFPAPETEFRVMRQFAPDELSKRLWDDPGPIVVDICRHHNDELSREDLEQILVPVLIAESDWKKWWTKAKAGLKKIPNMEVASRAPYTITYVDKPVALEDLLQHDLKRAHDPVAKIDAIGKYLRECKAVGQTPDDEPVESCAAGLMERARSVGKAHAAAWWAGVARMRELTGTSGGTKQAVEYFGAVAGLDVVLTTIDDSALLDAACACVVEGRPEDWADQLVPLLPKFPASVCDSIGQRLQGAGWTCEDFEPVVQQIMASPIEHFDAMLWLWDGPKGEASLPMPRPVTLISRIVRTLEECRRSDKIPSDTVKRIGSRARTVLAARKYERFVACMDEMDPSLGRALRRQIYRLDNLGHAVRIDLSKQLSRRFPPLDTGQQIQPWELEDVLYVTEEGLVRKQKEIDHHVNVKMKENAVAIGAAAEHGDLSENSEYKFALEERDLLRARLAQMNSEMADSRVISVDDVPTEHIGIGTRAFFERVGDGETYELTLVGPWEADPERAWFNYKTPLAKKVLGLKPNETVEFDHTGATGQYRFVRAENGLAQSV